MAAVWTWPKEEAVPSSASKAPMILAAARGEPATGDSSWTGSTTPAVLMVSDPRVLEFAVVKEKTILLQPKNVGRTPMAMLFPVGRDRSEWFFLTLHVNVQKAESR